MSYCSLSISKQEDNVSLPADQLRIRSLDEETYNGVLQEDVSLKQM